MNRHIVDFLKHINHHHLYAYHFGFARSLVEEARTALGFKSKTDTVVLALRELVRRRRLDELKGLLGRVQLNIDVPKEPPAAATRVIVVDTSVWVAAFRSGSSQEALSPGVFARRRRSGAAGAGASSSCSSGASRRDLAR